MPSDENHFWTLDPETGLITHGVAQNPSPTLLAEFLGHHYPDDEATQVIDQARAGAVIKSGEAAGGLEQTLRDVGIATTCARSSSAGGVLGIAVHPPRRHHEVHRPGGPLPRADRAARLGRVEERGAAGAVDSRGGSGGSSGAAHRGRARACLSRARTVR